MGKKLIKDRLEKECSVCVRKIHIIQYTDRSFRGGHYFFEIPISTKTEWERVLKAGTHTYKRDGFEFEIINKEPKAYKYVEYWECPKCYWRK